VVETLVFILHTFKLYTNKVERGIMRKPAMAFMLAFLVVMLFSIQAKAYNIFVWEHDNRLRISDPVLRSSLTATQAVMRTLDGLHLDYDSNANLPDSASLEEYDVVIVCLSWYCPG